MKTKRLFLQLALLALLLSILAFLGWFEYCIFLHNSICRIIIAGLSIILSGWLFLSVLHHLTKQPWLIILLFLLICSWGLATYQSAVCSGSDPIARVIAPLNNTLSIFFPSRGGFDECDISKTSSYQLLHLCAYFFFALLMFSIFGRRFINNSRRFLFLRSNKNIFWGDSPGGKLLAQDMLNTKLWQQPVFIFSDETKDDEEKEKALFEKFDSMGAIVLYHDFDNISRFPNGHRHFFLTENQDFNLKMALKLAETNNKKKIEIYLRTEMPRVDFLFRHLTNVELHILNQSGLVARQFVSEFPLIDLAIESKKVNDLIIDYDFKILFLGFGWQGRELLNKTICDAQFKGSSYEATIIDKDLDLKNGEYQLLFNECINEYHLSFMEDEGIRNIGSKHFYQWFKDHHHCFGRIMVALGDDTINFNISFALANLLIAVGEKNPQERLFVHITHVDKYLYDYPLKIFGRLDKIYTCDVVIAEMMDRVAKAVNFVYCNYRNEALTEINWNEAEKNWVNMSNKNSTFNKDSSRAVALNVENIIKIAGGKENFDKGIENSKMLEILAENEHLRWNAFHFTQGITMWNEIDDNNPTDAKLFMYPQDKAWLLKHACLVPYNKLDRISDRINQIKKKSGAIEIKGLEDFKKMDRMIIRHFGLFYKILHQNE